MQQPPFKIPSMWRDDNLIIIAYDDTQPGEQYITVPANPEDILTWINALGSMLNDGDILDLPGRVETQVDPCE